MGNYYILHRLTSIESTKPQRKFLNCKSNVQYYYQSKYITARSGVH